MGIGGGHTRARREVMPRRPALRVPSHFAVINCAEAVRGRYSLLLRRTRRPEHGVGLTRSVLDSTDDLSAIVDRHRRRRCSAWWHAQLEDCIAVPQDRTLIAPADDLSTLIDRKRAAEGSAPGNVPSKVMMPSSQTTAHGASEGVRLVPAIKPLSLMPQTALDVPPGSVPRSTIVPPSHRNAWYSPDAVLAAPTISPSSLMSVG